MAEVPKDTAPETITSLHAGGFTLVASLVLPLAVVLVGQTSDAFLVAAAISFALLTLGLWASRRCFVAFGLKIGRIVIPATIVTILFAIVIVLWGAFVENAKLFAAQGTARIWIWQYLVACIMAEILLVAFAVTAIKFGRKGWPIWKAIGLLYVLAGGSMLLLSIYFLNASGSVSVLESLFGFFGPPAYLGAFATIFVIAYPAASICHAMGVFQCARLLASEDGNSD